MSQHPDSNDNLTSTPTTDEQTLIDVDTASVDVDDNQSTPAADKHIRIVNTFMKRRTHMNKNAELALTAPSSPIIWSITALAMAT